MEAVLDVRNLHTRFERPDSVVYAVNGVSFQVLPGEWLGILGESGSGKSAMLMSILHLLGNNGQVFDGEIMFDGQDLLHMSKRELRYVRGQHIGVVFQNVINGFNQYLRVGQQIMEPLLEHGICSKAEAKQRAIALMGEMGIPDPAVRFANYPFELSGGMRQRAMIAAALACEPKLLLADEPTTALDTTIQVQVLAVLRRACERRKMSTVMVTHDIGVATNVCDRVLVLYGGQVMEMAEIDQFIQRPAHPYTLGLRSSALDNRRKGMFAPISGNAQTLIQPPVGCPFAPRCRFADSTCDAVRPAFRQLEKDHWVACHHVEGVAVNGG